MLNCSTETNIAEPWVTGDFRPRTATGHFSHKTVRHQDTLGHFGADLKTLRHQKRGTRHFDTSAVIEEKPGHFDPRQFRWDTAPPVIRLKLRHQFCGAEVSCGRSVRLPPRAGHFGPKTFRTRGAVARYKVLNIITTKFKASLSVIVHLRSEIGEAWRPPIPC